MRVNCDSTYERRTGKRNPEQRFMGGNSCPPCGFAVLVNSRAIVGLETISVMHAIQWLRGDGRHVPAAGARWQHIKTRQAPRLR